MWRKYKSREIFWAVFSSFERLPWKNGGEAFLFPRCYKSDEIFHQKTLNYDFWWKFWGQQRERKRGEVFLFLLLWIREEGGEIRRHALNINWTFFNFHPFYLLNLEGKTMRKSENIAMLISIRDIIFYVRSKTAW